MKLRLKLPYWLVSRLNGEHKAAKEYRKSQKQGILLARRRWAERTLGEIATEAGISQESLEVWMNSPTGYLHGCRPIDWMDDDPGTVLWAAKQAFNVEW